MLMSRRYWSSEPSSNDDFLLFGVVAMRVVPGMQRLRGRAAVEAEGECRPSSSGSTDLVHALAEPRPSDMGQPRETGGGIGREAEVDDLRPAAKQRIGH